MLAAIEAWGVEGALDAAQRHVRVRAVGPRARTPDPGARPARREAALLRLPGGHASCSDRSSRRCRASRLRARRSTARRSPLFLRYSYVPAPLSIWRGVRKLPPGHSCSRSATVAARSAIRYAYWDFGEVARAGRGQSAAPMGRAWPTSSRRLLSRCGAPADGRRRAARRVPVGRDRFLDRSWR